MTTSYYGQPVIKEPTWTPEIPFYLFSGGLAGASAPLAYLAERRGNDVLARRAWAVAFAGVSVSPALLISDLGVPSRFLNMLRLFKVTSPMSVGSWILAASGGAMTLAAADALLGLFPGLGAVAKPVSAALGLPLSTYTGALLAQTSVPVWHEARRELPFVFGASAAASAGAAATVLSPVRAAGPARRLAIGGAVAQMAGLFAMEKRLGDLGEPYELPPAKTFKRAAQVLTLAGTATIAAGAGRSRAAAVAGGAALLGGVLAERWSVFKAGFQSARDPKYTVAPQRERIASGRSRGASRKVPA